MYIIRRGLRHLRFMDFSTINGRAGYAFWRLGFVKFWRARLTPRLPRPDRPVRRVGGDGPVLIPVSVVEETAR